MGLKMNEVEQARYLLDFLSAATKVLSARFAMLLSLVLTFILFAWAMSGSSSMRIGIATIFALLVYLPTVWLDYSERNIRAALPQGE